MPFKRITGYRDMPFSIETPKGDFYNYLSVPDLPKKCEKHMYEIIRCRTVGVLYSEHGQYYLKHITNQSSGAHKVQVSMTFLKSPPQSAIVPYTVQILGDLQWKKRPVIFARILQPLHPAMALKLHSAMSRVQRHHLATSTLQDEDNT